jgi:hypothetical protein
MPGKTSYGDLVCVVDRHFLATSPLREPAELAALLQLLSLGHAETTRLEHLCLSGDSTAGEELRSCMQRHFQTSGQAATVAGERDYFDNGDTLSFALPFEGGRYQVDLISPEVCCANC